MGRRQVKEDIIEYLTKFNYQLISTEYYDIYSKIKVMCTNSHIYITTFKKFKYKKIRCRECFENRRRLGMAYIHDFIASRNLKCLSTTYINSKTHYIFNCCNGHQFKTSFHAIKYGKSGCPYCSKCAKYNIDEVNEYLNQFDYKLLSSKYINNRSYLDVECPKNHKYKVTFNAFKDRESRCPICYQNQTDSRGVRLILEYLETNNIDFKREYRFDDCRNIKQLPFDFAIFKDNNLFGLIEFQGKQHFIDNGVWQFERLVKNDNIKVQYCKQNDINFIAIRHDDNIVKDIHQFIQD